jgi:hypothetical protein
MVKITTLVMTVMLAAVATPGFAQVDYDGLRSVQELIVKFSGGSRDSQFSIHDEEDLFTRTTRRYVVGWGGQNLLFMVASCESLSVLFATSAVSFGSGKIESIWDDGDIVEHQFTDRTWMLVEGETDWLRRLTAHDALRVRVTANRGSLASDEFDLQNATLGDSTGQTHHVRILFDEIGCAFE